MFLDILLQKNPALADYAVFLHRQGQIVPDTYVIDADSLLENALAFRTEAQKLGITSYAMTKQIGRNPFVLDLLKAEGFSFCAVDFREAQALAKRGCSLGHVGHLVQIPLKMIPHLLEFRPKYWTVYSYEQAKALDSAARAQGFVQKILLRPISVPYAGQESPHRDPQSLLAFAEELKSLCSLKIEGLTSFPCFLYQDGEIVPTPNAALLEKCFAALESLGLSVKNMPSHNSMDCLPLMKRFGATHAEPGHALTGTCPSHAGKGGPEKPALCYISEISHHFEGKSLAYGGGWYPRSHFKKALIGGCAAELIAPKPDNIDYTLSFEGLFPPGSVVLGAFRTQIFTTRSHTAVVSGLAQGSPRLLGLATSQGGEIFKA